MNKFSLLTKIYMISALIIGGALIVWQMTNIDSQDWRLLLVICVLAALLQTLKIEGATFRTSYNLSWVVYGFALVLLGAPETMLVILVAHLVEWIWHRYPWYIQSFNIASFGLAVTIAGFAYDWISPSQAPPTLSGSLAILTALALFTLINHLMVGLIVKMARGQSLAESGVFGPLTLALDFGLLCLGAAGALIWLVNPYGIILVALLAMLLQNVLRVPSLQRQSDTDPKVGLYNSRYFARMVDQELDRANRFNRPLTVVMSDMDLLREVNNAYGHLAGDVVLQGVAQILQEKAREYDTVARFGGEEFAILMPETMPNQAYAVVEAMRSAIEKAHYTVATSDTPIKVTMSFGIAGRLDSDLSTDELLHQADMAVYEAKEVGRNCTRINGVLEANAVASLPEEGTLAEEAGEMEAAESPAPVSPDLQEHHIPDRPDDLTDDSKASQLDITKPSPTWQIRLYVVSVAFAALMLAGFLVRPEMDQDWIGLAAFALLVVLVEALAVNIYVKETSVSTSAAPLVAGILLFGPIAAVILGPVVALAAFFRQRSQLDRLVFNTSNHLIGGLMVAGIVMLSGRAFVEWSMPVQIIITILAISLIFLSSTVLIAGVISISSQQSFKEIWGERFRWLFLYYLALGVVAYALIFSYFTAGMLGIVVVLIPLVMLRYSQKQYIDHTEAVVAKLRNTNVTLTKQAEEITLLNEELLVALAKATDMRDPYVMEHSLNVARYAKLIAQELGLSTRRVEMVRKAGLLHDIGKLSIPDAILFKPGRLTDEEYAVIQAHSLTGAQLIHNCHSLEGLIPIIQNHHEHYDGSGYPYGLAGEEIPLEARILCVADALEAMSSDRPYRKARTPLGTVEEMRKFAGSQFDPQVIDAFIRVVQKQGETVIINSARSVQARKITHQLPDNDNKHSPISEDIIIGQPSLVSG